MKIWSSPSPPRMPSAVVLVVRNPSPTLRKLKDAWSTATQACGRRLMDPDSLLKITSSPLPASMPATLAWVTASLNPSPVRPKSPLAIPISVAAPTVMLPKLSTSSAWMPLRIPVADVSAVMAPPCTLIPKFKVMAPARVYDSAATSILPVASLVMALTPLPASMPMAWVVSSAPALPAATPLSCITIFFVSASVRANTSRLPWLSTASAPSPDAIPVARDSTVPSTFANAAPPPWTL